MDKLIKKYKIIKENWNEIHNQNLIKKKDVINICKLEQELIEEISFSTPEKIYQFMIYLKKKDVLESPFWLRVISFKLIVCQTTNKKFIKDAISDMKLFGVDAEKLVKEYTELL